MALSAKMKLEVINALCARWATMDDVWDEWVFMTGSSVAASEFGYLHGVASTRTQVLLTVLGAENQDVAVELQEVEERVAVRAVS